MVQPPPLVPRKSRGVRKVEGERDRALERLTRFKAKKRQKKARRRRQSLSRQVVSLTLQTTRAIIDGEV